MADYRYVARPSGQPAEGAERYAERGQAGNVPGRDPEDYSQKELEAVHRTMKGLPPEMPYQERVRETETAKRQIQEFLIAELRDLLSPAPEEPDPEDRPTESSSRTGIK